MTYLTTYASPLGAITLTSDGKNLTGLWFDGQKHYLYGADAETAVKDDLLVFMQTRAWLDAYFAGLAPDVTGIPLAPAGTDYQRRVWDALQTIPYGETVTYGLLSQTLRKTKKTSPRAVGNAVSRNPISLLIPCHRVVGADGSLTGYAGGVDRKRALLRMEARKSKDTK